MLAISLPRAACTYSVRRRVVDPSPPTRHDALSHATLSLARGPPKDVGPQNAFAHTRTLLFALLPHLAFPTRSARAVSSPPHTSFCSQGKDLDKGLVQEVKSDSEEFWSGIKNLKPQDTETMKQEDAANLQTAVTEVAQLVSY